MKNSEDACMPAECKKKEFLDMALDDPYNLVRAFCRKALYGGISSVG